MGNIQSNYDVKKRLIELYVKNDYNDILYRNICNEIMNGRYDNEEQRRGLFLVYDYIQGYNFGDKPLDIFVSSLKINSLLWKPTDDKNNKDIIKQQSMIKEKVESLKDEARREKNLAKFKEASKLEKELSSMGHKAKLGGILRSNDYEDEVKLLDTDIEVPKARVAMDYMNSYINPSKKAEFEKVLNSDDIIEYISYCVKETTELIYYQPFMDGNKRTFLALLNLMFKVKGIPPVYVKSSDREEYINALIKGMKDKDYSELIDFYLFKICESIYELDNLSKQNSYKR